MKIIDIASFYDPMEYALANIIVIMIIIFCETTLSTFSASISWKKIWNIFVLNHSYFAIFFLDIDLFIIETFAALEMVLEMLGAG